MNFFKFGAIDIGSNAIRLLISDISHEKGRSPQFKKVTLVRLPIRLGQDVFVDGSIAPKNEQDLLETMKGFRHLLNAYHVKAYRACATSAMRDAANGPELVAKVAQQAGIDIEIIDGQMEAQLLYSTHIAEQLSQDRSYLYVDVGGGSTEITLFSQKKVVRSQSFNIGTIRLLNNLVKVEAWDQLKAWLGEIGEEAKPLTLIGSGGNVNKIHKLLDPKEKKNLSLREIEDMYLLLDSMTFEERIRELGLNTYRADVIVHAARIFVTIMRKTKSVEMIVPKVGLVDGIVHQLFEEFMLREGLA